MTPGRVLLSLVVGLSLLATGCRDAQRDVDARNAIDDYYRAIEDTRIEVMRHQADLRGPLVLLGRRGAKLLIADLQDPDVAAPNKVKAIFALGAYPEEGLSACDGLLIPTLIELLGHQNEEVVWWSYFYLESVVERPPGTRQDEWSRWWHAKGEKEYRDRCEG